MKITVIGMGKIGLPLAIQYSKKNHTVIGVDLNSQVVDAINRGVPPFPGEANIENLLSEVVEGGYLKGSLDTTGAVSQSDVVVVIVPVYVNHLSEPDFASIDAATLAIAHGLKPGTLISYETTLPIGTTKDRFAPTLEKVSGLTAGIDFHLVFSPERVLTGRVFEDLRKYPKIIGGITSRCTDAGVAFYESVLDFDPRPDLDTPNGVWKMDSTESAEFVKLAETTYRDVNIGLANQFAKLADKKGLNVYQVIEAANSQFYSNIHMPGIAVGGHCIPVYPHFYLQSDSDAEIVRVARSINKGMPEYSIHRVMELVGDVREKEVLILGISYRAGVKEVAFSGALDLIAELEKQGALVSVWDPLFSKDEVLALGMLPFNGDKALIEIVFLQTDDKAFNEILRSGFTNLACIFDGRNVFNGVSPIQNVELMSIGIA
jgi:nucleotide sugar dehydrogenase